MPVSANLPPQAKNERADKADAVQLPGIARVLIQHQLLSPEQAREAHAKAQAAENGNFLDELVINSKVLNPLRLATFLAETFGMPLMDLAWTSAPCPWTRSTASCWPRPASSR